MCIALTVPKAISLLGFCKNRSIYERYMYAQFYLYFKDDVGNSKTAIYLQS